MYTIKLYLPDTLSECTPVISQLNFKVAVLWIKHYCASVQSIPAQITPYGTLEGAL